jgi:hypothetical protein
VAAQNNDLTAKTLAYGSLGRTHHALQNYTQAVMYLQEGERKERSRESMNEDMVLEERGRVGEG